MQKISPFLWFDNEAEQAAELYTSVFRNSRITGKSYYPDVEGRDWQAGSVMTVGFIIDGLEFTALNGGPQFTFSEAISFVVDCETQEEVDEYWRKLTDGGQEGQCGWLTDRFGLSWQIVPRALGEMLSSPDRDAAQRATVAMLGMKKLDIAALRRAFDDA
jgi:predicted 3-demethylubiquinone-9 3-methyltransferase (glyoxalase superfamily)